MALKLVVAVTDGDWFEFLSGRDDLTEINFWAPSSRNFRALEPGELFLFKLHSPQNAIVGGGVFAHASTMPCSLAWKAFGHANGAASYGEMRARIARYRHTTVDANVDFEIGCRLLTQPFFLPQEEWLPVPSDWSPNIVQFKTYDIANDEANALWELLSERVTTGNDIDHGLHEQSQMFGGPQLIVPRLGQGAFRLLVTDIYERQCSVTGERTLPVLDAAHIKPYSLGGGHDPRNGLLLRTDLHRLFDDGYVTITPDYHFEVSSRIKEEFSNGKEYYRLHGSAVRSPRVNKFLPDKQSLCWHNDTVYRG